MASAYINRKMAEARKEAELLRRVNLSEADTFAEAFEMGFGEGREGVKALESCSIAETYCYSQAFRDGYYQGHEAGFVGAEQHSFSD